VPLNHGRAPHRIPRGVPPDKMHCPVLAIARGYTYDDMNRVATVTNPAGKRVTTSYTALGQRRTMFEPEGGRFSYVYDDAMRLTYLENPQNQRTSYSYDAESRVTVQRLANGARASYSYDNDNRMLRLANITSTNTTLSSFDYSYDSVGNRTREIESSGIRVTWTYDNLYQLTRARRSGANSYDTTFTYSGFAATKAA